MLEYRVELDLERLNHARKPYGRGAGLVCGGYPFNAIL